MGKITWNQTLSMESFFVKYLEVDGFSADWALLIDVLCLLWGDEITEFSLTQSASFSSCRVESLRDDRLKSSKSKLSSSAALKTQEIFLFLFWFWKRRAFESQLLHSSSANKACPRWNIVCLFFGFAKFAFLWKWVKLNSICSDVWWIWKGKGKQ